MKRRLPLIITICLVCIGIALAIVLVGRAGREASPSETANVTRGDIMVIAPMRGNLEMPDKAYLSFGIAGTVEEVLVEEGNNVTKGQVLARLDAPSLESGVEMAELQVEIAQRQVKIARAQYEIALINWKEPLLGQNEEVLREQVNIAKASWETAKLNLEMTELNLESAKLNLEKAIIVAAFDGMIAAITISEGEEISAAALAAPAISLIDLGQIEMRGFVDELDISVVEPGQEVTIIVDALRDLEIKGTVALVSPMGTARLGVVSYEATIALEGSYEGLRDGMSATADIIIERRDAVILVPNRAIRGTRERPMVVVEIDGQTEEREITLGLSDGINTEVLSGLEEGERVVLPARGSGTSNFGPFVGH